MSKHLSSFEQSVKNSLEGAELPYENGSWCALENRLDKIDASNSSNKSIRWAIAAGLLFITTTVLLYQNTNTETISLPIVENTNNTIAIEKAIKTKSKNKNSIQGKTSNSRDIETSVNDITTNISVDKKILSESTNTTSVQNTNSISSQNVNRTEKPDVKLNKGKANKKLSSNGLSFAPSVREACSGTEIAFDLTTDNLDGSYLWNFGDGNFSNEKNPSNVYTKPGIYSITLAVTSSLDGVIKSNTKPVLITITPKPTADFDWEFVSEYNEVPTIKVVNQSLNAIQSEWSVNNEVISNEINLVKSFKKKGEYLLSLTVSNINGCTDTKYKSILIENDYNILPPKTFSPNNDGKDDTFLPRSLRVLGKEFELSIYSNDQLVYQTNNANKAWDGRLKDGSIAQINQKFPWVVILYDTNGNKQYYSGIVTVVP